MTFQIRHTKQSLFSGNFFKVLVVLLLVCIFIFVFSFFGSMRSLVPNILSPFFKMGNYFYDGISQVPEFFSDRNKLIEENNNLSDELENSRLEIIDYDSIKYENQKLREELKIKPIGNFVASSVLAKSPQIPLDSLFLDRGTEDGINNGDLVLASDNVLIGKIDKVTKNRATAVLNSFAGVISYGYIARTNELLEIKGVGGGGIETKVPIDFDITIGDKIIANDSSTLLSAVVGAIEENKSSGFKNIFMSLPVNVSKINIVFVEPVINE